MICSSCSAPIKPVVAIDIDGTLGDYHGHFLNFLEAYLDQALVRWLYDGSQNFGDWICKSYDIDRRTYRDIKLAYRQGAQKRSMPMFDGARELAFGVRGLGAELWLTTSRPYLRLDSIDPDTREWLRRKDLHYDHLLYDEHKYSLLAEQVDPNRVVAVFDDLGSMYDSAAVEFGENVPILRRTCWNGAVKRQKVVEDLEAARLMICAHIQDWRIKHHFDKLPESESAA